MRAWLLSVFIAASILLGPAILLPESGLADSARAAEGKLRSMESKLKGSRKSGTSVSRHGKALLAYLLVDFFVNIAPYLLFPRYHFYHQSYPYEMGEGYFEFYGETPYSAPGTLPMSLRRFAFEVRGEYQIDSPELHGYRFTGKARLSWTFNVDFDVTQFREWRNLYEFDTLTFIKIDGLFNLSSSPWHDIDLGFGFSYLDGVDLFSGVNVKLTGDIFPRKPVGIHFAACASAFPGGTLYETEVAVGFFLRRFELRVGWRALWVDDIEIHGPMTGVTIWF